MSRTAVIVIAFLIAIAVAVPLGILSSPGTTRVPGKVWSKRASSGGGTERPEKTEAAAEPVRQAAKEPAAVKALPTGYVPPRVHSSALATFVNRESRDERITDDIHVRLPKVVHPDDIKAVVAVLLDTQDEDTVRHEATNLLRRSGYPALTEDLLTVLHNPEERERFRAFVVQHLGLQAEEAKDTERSRIVGELRVCLRDRHTSVRREALLALVRLDDPLGTETALEWFAEAKAETDAVLDLCIRVIRKRDLREYLPSIRKLIGGPNENAARQAMVTVAQWGDQESRSLLEEAAKCTRPLVKRAADAALKKLDSAKADLPEPASDERAERRLPRSAGRGPEF